MKNRTGHVLFAIFIATSVLCSSDFSYLQKKHDAAIEMWILYSKLNLSETEKIGLTVFFFSGKWLFISGNAIFVTLLKFPSKNFQHDSKFFIPPFHRVKHNYSLLDENFSGNILLHESDEGYYYIKTTLSKLKTKIKFYPKKGIVPIGPRGELSSDIDKGSGYSMPGLEVEAVIDGMSDKPIYGEGHFDHFWADKHGEDHDQIVAHTDLGYDFTITYFHESKDWRERLSGSFINISYPDKTYETVTGYNYEIIEWWYSDDSKRKYPIELKIEIPEKNIELSIVASRPNQEISIMGTNQWMGFCSVKAEIQGKSTEGWAFVMPMGYKER